jgi:hypothetical protein
LPIERPELREATGIREANSLASLWLSNPELREGHRDSQLNKKPTRNSGLFALWHPDGILLEKGIPMRQQWMEHCWTALAGREALNPMDCINNEEADEAN